MKKTHIKKMLKWAIRNLPDYAFAGGLAQVILSGKASRTQVYGFHPTKKRTKGRIASERQVAAHREELRKQHEVKEDA